MVAVLVLLLIGLAVGASSLAVQAQETTTTSPPSTSSSTTLDTSTTTTTEAITPYGPPPAAAPPLVLPSVSDAPGGRWAALVAPLANMPIWMQAALVSAAFATLFLQGGGFLRRLAERFAEDPY